MADYPIEGKATGIFEDLEGGVRIGEEGIGAMVGLPTGYGLDWVGLD